MPNAGTDEESGSQPAMTAVYKSEQADELRSGTQQQLRKSRMEILHRKNASSHKCGQGHATHRLQLNNSNSSCAEVIDICLPDERPIG
uniref:Uncharacterized protein n=1 Tax=Ascaris lumbricoides TaxID=6252 RepID=A0A0M3I6Q3_ASCLU